MEERNDINKFRKKKARQKLVFRLSLLLLAALVILLTVINWGRIIAPFKDAALDVGAGGFPVELPGSAGYVLNEMGESFYLLTDTYIYTYTSEGALITDIQHGFQNPISDANKKRVLVYDKNGKEFSLFSRTGEEFSYSTDDTIVFGEIGNDQRSAVVTTSTRYSNYLYVYNGEGKQIFRWASPSYKIMQVEFSDDDSSVFVSALGSGGGELQLYVLRFDLNNSESHIWQTYIGNDISYSIESCSDGLFVVTANGGCLLDKQTGELLSQTVFSKTIWDIPPIDGMRTVIFKDTASSGNVIVEYGNKLEVGETLYVNNLTATCSDSGKLYVLSGSLLTQYGDALQAIKSYELDDVYSDMIIMNGYAYLLGYNEVQRIQL